ncbi:MAG: DUF294 nucleotidyltransferase-like domain-containing protein [Gammaproteobacteria bacterium]
MTDYATPLTSLPAVVIDTETTGLDADKARVVQIAGVRIRGGIVEGATPPSGDAYDRLVNPGIEIPPASTAIHGIADVHVASAPAFAEIAGEFARFMGSDIVIGHTIGYDLTLLRREHERAGLPWCHPSSLDVRMLAQLAAPSLAGYGLEQLCEWLGIEIEGRHSATGDALATARVFVELLPRLRQRNIRTLAEAQAASRELVEKSVQTVSGVVELAVADDTLQIDATELWRVDSFPYRHRVGEVMSTPPAFVESDTPLRDVMRRLIERNLSSVFVRGTGGETGIVTERDVLRVLDREGARALDRLAHEIMSGGLKTVSAQAYVYRAIGRMDRLGLRHLGVHDENGEVVGAVTTRNLLRHRATTAVILGDAIASAPDAPALARAWGRMPVMARTLVDDGVDPRTVASVISSEICNLTRRAAQLCEIRMLEAGRGGPPVPYAVLVLGSAGRGESLLAADQDNAIVYAGGEPGGAEDEWFEAMSVHMADVLDEAGVPYCKGGVMAKNSPWRKSAAGWRETVNLWVRRTQPQDLLNVDIFFDAVPVHGDRALGEAIWRHAYEAGKRSPLFIKLLSELLKDWRSPFTLFGGLNTDPAGRIDLKRAGLLPLFTGARVLSIKHGIEARSTPERLQGVADAGIGSRDDTRAMKSAHRTILGAMLDQQIADAQAGVPLSPKIDPKRLGKAARKALGEALKQVPVIIDHVREGRF